MDMKKFLQVVDGAVKKPAEGANDMKKFLRVVAESDLNQPAATPMPGQNMPPTQISLDHIDAKTLDSAEGFKAAMKLAASEAGVEPKTAQTVDKIVVAAPDGTVDIQKTFVTIAAQFSDHLGELVKMIQDLALSYKKGMDSPEFQQFDDETKQSVKAAFAELTAMIPKIVADAKKMSADAKGMQPQPAVQEGAGMSRFLSIVTEGKGPLNRLSQAESITLNTYNEYKPAEKPSKPSLIDKYFKEVEVEFAESQNAKTEKVKQLAERVSNKVGNFGHQSTFKKHISQSQTPPEHIIQMAKSGAKTDGHTRRAHKEDANPTDSVTLDIPLVIRLLEYAREDAGDDMSLHVIAERLVELSKKTDVINMDQYNAIVTGEVDESLRTDNPCWKGYHPVGTKKKGGRTVPNCVPK